MKQTVLCAVLAGGGGAVVSAGKPPALLLAAPLQTGAAENRPQAGLWLVTAYDLSAVWAEQARQLRQFVLIELGTLAAALAAAAAGARALTGPLRRLEAAAHAAAAGSRLAAFEEAGLLPPAAGEAARALLAGYTHDGCVWAGETGAFHTVQVMQGENFLQLTWHESGAPVAFVLYAPGAGQGARPAAMLAAWKEALGVDALPDWEEEPAGEDGAAATSASAELGLHVTAGKDRLELALRPAREETNGRGNAAG